MIKYKTEAWNSKIEPVTVVKETAKQLVVEYDCYGKTHQRRAAKESAYDNYFDTWEEAHEHLIDRAAKRVESLRSQLQTANGNLGNIKGMKQEQPNAGGINHG